MSLCREPASQPLSWKPCWGLSGFPERLSLGGEDLRWVEGKGSRVNGAGLSEPVTEPL